VGRESARAGKFTRWPVARQAWPPHLSGLAWGVFSQPFSWPAAARCPRRCPGSATATRYLAPSATRQGPDDRLGPDRKCRCTCPWPVRCLSPSPAAF